MSNPLYLPSKAIITVEETISALNLDLDYPDISKLSSLALEATAKVNVWCNHDFSADDPVNPLAKAVARDYVYLIWYGEDQHVSDRIQDNVIQLNGLLKTDGTYYSDTEKKDEEDAGV